MHLTKVPARTCQPPVYLDKYGYTPKASLSTIANHQLACNPVMILLTQSLSLLELGSFSRAPMAMETFITGFKCRCGQAGLKMLSSFILVSIGRYALDAQILVPNRNALDDLILFETIKTSFLAISTLLHSTEGSLGCADLSSIDANHADLELLSDPHGTTNILREEVTGEAEFGIVGEPDNFLLGVELEDGRERTESLLTADDHLRGHSGENGGVVIEALGPRGLATGLNLRSLRHSVFNVFANLINSRLVDQGALRGR